MPATLPFDAGFVRRGRRQFGVQFFADKVAAAAEARRVLRPGGRVSLSARGADRRAIRSRASRSKPPQACFPMTTAQTFYHDAAWSYGDPARLKATCGRWLPPRQHPTGFASSAAHRRPTTRRWDSCKARPWRTPSTSAVDTVDVFTARLLRGVDARARERPAGDADARLDRSRGLRGTNAGQFRVLRV